MAPVCWLEKERQFSPHAATAQTVILVYLQKPARVRFPLHKPLQTSVICLDPLRSTKSVFAGTWGAVYTQIGERSCLL